MEQAAVPAYRRLSRIENDRLTGWNYIAGIGVLCCALFTPGLECLIATTMGLLGADAWCSAAHTYRYSDSSVVVVTMGTLNTNNITTSS